MATTPADFTMRGPCYRSSRLATLDRGFGDGALRRENDVERFPAVLDRAERMLFPAQAPEEVAQFVEEHPVPLEALWWRDDLPFLRHAPIEPCSLIVLVPGDGSAGPDDREAMLRR